MKKSLLVKLVALGILVVLVVLAVFIFVIPRTKADKPWLFGMVCPMTGDSAAQGAQLVRGTRLACDEINAMGGVEGRKLDFIVGDDMANPLQSTLVAEKFAANDELLFILGPNNSGCAMAAQPIYARVNLPFLAPVCSNTKLTEQGYTNFFRLFAREDVQSRLYMKFMGLELKTKRIAIIWENNDYGKQAMEICRESAPEFGITVLVDESYVPGLDQDFSAQITKFKGLGVDGVMFIGEYTPGAQFLKQKARLGLDCKVLGGSGMTNAMLMQLAGETAEGCYVSSSYNADNPDPVNQEFVKKYMEKYDGEVPGEWGAFTYDWIYTVYEAMSNGGTTREKLIEKLREVDLQGVTGRIRFDEKGDVPERTMAVMVVKDGRFETYIPGYDK